VTPDRKRLSVVAGGCVTAVSTGVLLALPFLVPLEVVKHFVFAQTNEWWTGNPFTQLRLFGGIPGGIVAGYIARNHWGENERGIAMTYGLYAVLFGLAVVYAAFVAYSVGRSILVSGTFPPPVYVITVVPIVYALPLVPVYVVGGVLAAVVGNSLSRARRGSNMDPTGD